MNTFLSSTIYRIKSQAFLETTFVVTSKQTVKSDKVRDTKMMMNIVV